MEGEAAAKTWTSPAGKLTPGLHVEGDHGLGSWLRALGGLLLRVLLQTLLLDSLALLILFLVVRAEEVDLVVVSVRGLGRVGGELVRLRAIGGVLLGGVTWQGGEFGLEGLDVLVPAVGVGVVLRLRGGLDGLEGLDVGLGGGVAGEAGLVSAAFHGTIACKVCEEELCKAKHIRGAEIALDVVIWRGLKPPHQHGPNCFHQSGWEEGGNRCIGCEGDRPRLTRRCSCAS